MDRVYVRCRRIPWVPECVAQHTRLLVGGHEHYFVKWGNPRHHEASDSDALIRDVYIGDATVEAVKAAIAEVDRHFIDGTYSFVTRDCSRYVFCLCAALFPKETLLKRFPASCNGFQNCLHSFDLEVLAQATGFRAPLHRLLWHRVTDRLRAADAVDRLVQAVVRGAVPAIQ